MHWAATSANREGLNRVEGPETEIAATTAGSVPVHGCCDGDEARLELLVGDGEAAPADLGQLRVRAGNDE